VRHQNSERLAVLLLPENLEVVQKLDRIQFARGPPAVAQVYFPPGVLAPRLGEQCLRQIQTGRVQLPADTLLQNIRQRASARHLLLSPAGLRQGEENQGNSAAQGPDFAS